MKYIIQYKNNKYYNHRLIVNKYRYTMSETYSEERVYTLLYQDKAVIINEFNKNITEEVITALHYKFMSKVA